MIGYLFIFLFISVLGGLLSGGFTYLLLIAWQRHRDGRLNYLPSGLTNEEGWIGYLGETHDVTMIVAEAWNKRSSRTPRGTFRQSISAHDLLAHLQKARAHRAELQPEIEVLNATYEQYKQMAQGLESIYYEKHHHRKTLTEHTFTFYNEQAAATNTLFEDWFGTASPPSVPKIREHQLATLTDSDLQYHRAIIKTLNTSLSADRLLHNWLDRQVVDSLLATISDTHLKLSAQYQGCQAKILQGHDLNELTGSLTHDGPVGFKERAQLMELLQQGLTALKTLTELIGANKACFDIMEQWVSGEHSDYRIVDMAKTLRVRNFPNSAFSFPDTTAQTLLRGLIIGLSFVVGTVFTTFVLLLSLIEWVST